MSRSGKELLVKSVAQTLPAYAMNVFLLPNKINNDIEKALTKFWWNSNPNQKSKINWMSWTRMEKHKSAGGMGFRNFRDFNIAMLGKQAWRLITNPSTLVARLYKAKYYATSDFLQAKLGHNPSFIWWIILEAKNLLLDGVRWRVGNEKSIKILDQPWLLLTDHPYITSDSQALQD
ncbi:putative mitochondrial protein AtMg00310 [Apium graveolens]|uniref:putative mitochondrial protein AtMg00310 n=1 Tax=Apium graveolens TaxID=4045 RepID=UPI003D7BF587